MHKDKKQFRTDNMSLAVFLLCKEFKLLDIKKDKPSHAIFIFQSEAEHAVSDFFNNAEIPVLDFINNQKLIKQRLYSVIRE